MGLDSEYSDHNLPRDLKKIVNAITQQAYHFWGERRWVRVSLTVDDFSIMQG